MCGHGRFARRCSTRLGPCPYGGARRARYIRGGKEGTPAGCPLVCSSGPASHTTHVRGRGDSRRKHQRVSDSFLPPGTCPGGRHRAHPSSAFHVNWLKQKCKERVWQGIDLRNPGEAKSASATWPPGTPSFQGRVPQAPGTPVSSPFVPPHKQGL